jgi:putative copper resistance protein D
MQVRIRAVAAVIVALGVVAVLLALSVTGGGYEPPAPGLPDPGALVGWGLPILRLLTDLLAAMTIGWLVCAAFLDPSGRDGVLSDTGRSDVLRAVLCAAAWSVAAGLQLFFTVANVLGVTLDRAFSPQIAATYAMEIPASRALAWTCVAAAVVAVGALLTATTGVTAGWLVIAVGGAGLPALAGHGAGLGDHGLAITSGAAHLVAATLWLGGLAALTVHAVRRDGMDLPDAVRRFGWLASICVALMALTGFANGYVRLDTPGQLLSTGYGQLLVLKTLLVIVIVAVAAYVRRRIAPSLGERRSALTRWLTVEVALIVTSFGIGVALASSAYPRQETRLPTYGETLLGFLYPAAPTASSLLLGFRLEALFFVGVIVAAALYIGGIVRLYRRGDSWSWGRTICWLLGLVLVFWTTNGGIAIYAQVSVGLHMVQHMTMTMLAPIALVLGAPATLALRALKPSTGAQRGPREWLVWFLHSPIARVLTNPFFVMAIYAVGLYGLYFTPAFAWLMGSHIGHIVMELHFLAAGYLFAWIIIGIDPRPKPLPYSARFLLVLLALGIHGFFAVAVMMGSTPLATEWFGLVRPPWVTDPLRDTEFGGQIAWGISEIPTLLLLLALAVQWSRSDAREARRLDRQADRDGDAELKAYNAYLEALDARSRGR